MQNTQTIEMTNGRQIIYGVPEKEYHELERFSSSGIKKLLVSAQDFWISSWMNPHKKQVKSEALNLGSAYHSRILEGPVVFLQKYAVRPVCDGRTKEGKELLNQFRSMYPNAEEIDQNSLDEIIRSSKFVEERFSYFKDGKSEVTILWDDEETGVPMKARIDYLKPGVINDLKTFSNSKGLPVEFLLAKHIVQYHYHIQSAVYTEAMPNHEFNFIFAQTGGPLNIICKPFPSDLLLADKGRDLMRIGINKFRDMYEKFGTKPWIDEWEIKSFTDMDFPNYALEE